MRRLWQQVHLWLGLTLGVVGIAVGVTGSLLLYDEAIDARLNPARHAVSGTDAALSPGQYVKEAAQGRGRVVGLRLPEEAGQPVVAIVRGEGGPGVFQRVFLDPPSGRALGAAPGGGLVGWLHRFHENLTLREYHGREIVGLVGIAMLISSLSGIYLWWPGRRRVRQSLGLRAGFTLSRNLHYLAGFYGAVVLALLSFTGIWLAYVDAGRSVVAAFSPLSPSPREIQAGPPEGKTIGVDEAAAAAIALYPGAKPASLGLPAGPRGVFRVALRTSDGPAMVYVDQGGKVLRRIDAASTSAGDRFLSTMRRLHEGEIGVAAGRPLLFLGGLLPLLLTVTGALMWLRRKSRGR